MTKPYLPPSPADYRSRVAVESACLADPLYRKAVLDKCRDDVEWFVDYFCWTFDPRSDMPDRPFFLYDFQRETLQWLETHYQAPSDGLIEKSRDMGATWLLMAFILHKWLFHPGFNGLVGSKKEEAVDNRLIDSLFGKLDYLIDSLPGWMIPASFSKRKHRVERRLLNPANNNIIVGESSNSEFSRSGRYSIIIYDEGAFWPDFESSWRAGGQATKCRIPVSTPNGMEAFARLRHSGKIDVLTLHWSKHPHKDQAWFKKETERMTDVDIAQELEISYDRSVAGIVYPGWKDITKGKYEYNPKLPLYVSIDFGIRDPTALIWAQRNSQTGRIYLLECYSTNGKPADYYIPLITGELPGDWPYSYTDDEMELIARHSLWGVPIVYGDPAASQRAQTDGNSIKKVFRKHRLHLITKPESQHWKERYNQTSLLIKHMVWDEIGCAALNEAMLNSRFKEVNLDAQTFGALQKPIHNWASHYRSALEYLCVNLPEGNKTRAAFERPAPIVVRRSYDSL